MIVVDHDMHVVAQSDWMIDIGPGAGDRGGRIVVAGFPIDVSATKERRTAPDLRRFIERGLSRTINGK